MFLALLPRQTFDFVINFLDSKLEIFKDISDYTSQGVILTGKKRVIQTHSITIHTLRDCKGFGPFTIKKLLLLLSQHHLPISVWHKYLNRSKGLILTNACLHSGLVALNGESPFAQEEGEVFEGKPPPSFRFYPTKKFEEFFNKKNNLNSFERFHTQLLTHITGLSVSEQSSLSALPSSFLPPLSLITGGGEVCTSDIAIETKMATSGVSVATGVTEDDPFTKFTCHCAVKSELPTLNNVCVFNQPNSSLWKVSVVEVENGDLDVTPEQQKFYISMLKILAKNESASAASFDLTTAVCFVGGVGELLSLFEVIPDGYYIHRVNLQTPVAQPWGPPRPVNDWLDVVV